MEPGLYEIPHLEIPVSKRDLIILEAVQGLGKCAALIFFPKRGSVGNFYADTENTPRSLT